ncbi:RNA polymerase sigma factor [Shigella sonnei]|nr:RNA polymerase sigma factor [Shigella sonnei]
MSQNTLKVHDLNEDAEFDENGVEVFDEKALVEEEPSDNDLAEEELLSQGATQRVLDATQLYRLFTTVNGRRRSLFCASRTAWRCRLSPPDDRE